MTNRQTWLGALGLLAAILLVTAYQVDRISGPIWLVVGAVWVRALQEVGRRIL